MLAARVTLLAAAVTGVARRVQAKCANDCNGKGECNALNQCDCFPNFRGPDCSFRICPAGKAFVDTPLGDIDGDGDVGVDLVYQKDVSRQPVSELYHVDYASARPSFMNTRQWDEAHFYAECSNKGECDPINGICVCYPGYDGSACSRNACPNDCSGHGTCKSYEGSSYAGWDIEATTYCDCDARWTGASCSLRVCPQGVDPVETSNVDTSRLQRIAFKTFGPLDWDDDEFDMGVYPFGDVKFTLTATDEYGDEWTTELMTVKYDAFHTESQSVAHVYFLPRLLTKGELVGKHNRRHVSETVEDALEALPHRSMGDVSVIEVYTMVSVTDLEDEFESFVWQNTNYTDLHCGLTDIYDQPANGRSIIGCGLPTVDKYLGTIASGLERDSGLDIKQYLDDGVAHIMLVGTGDRFLASSHVSPIVIEASTTGIQPGDLDISQGHLDVGSASGDGIYSYGYAYYMYPHFNNDDPTELRFPLLADPALTTSDWHTEEYSRFLLFDIDAQVGDLTVNSKDYLAGLSLFVRFSSKPTMQTLLRVDYFYENEHLLKFAEFKAGLTSGWQNLFNNGDTNGYDSVVGDTHEGCSAAVCEESNELELVVVHDIGALRVWDVYHHGVQKYFLGDGHEGADAELHECSKRGICDFETGLCDCFSGFAGVGCAEVNALAYGI
jgi:hypothetical protein